MEGLVLDRPTGVYLSDADLLLLEQARLDLEQERSEQKTVHAKVLGSCQDWLNDPTGGKLEVLRADFESAISEAVFAKAGTDNFSTELKFNRRTGRISSSGGVDMVDTIRAYAQMGTTPSEHGRAVVDEQVINELSSIFSNTDSRVAYRLSPINRGILSEVPKSLLHTTGYDFGYEYAGASAARFVMQRYELGGRDDETIHAQYLSIRGCELTKHTKLLGSFGVQAETELEIAGSVFAAEGFEDIGSFAAYAYDLVGGYDTVDRSELSSIVRISKERRGLVKPVIEAGLQRVMQLHPGDINGYMTILKETSLNVLLEFPEISSRVIGEEAAAHLGRAAVFLGNGNTHRAFESMERAQQTMAALVVCSANDSSFLRPGQAESSRFGCYGCPGRGCSAVYGSEAEFTDPEGRKVCTKNLACETWNRFGGYSGYRRMYGASALAQRLDWLFLINMMFDSGQEPDDTSFKFWS